MTDYEAIKNYLRAALSPKRYIHSENTAAAAERLAAIYKLDSSKAFTAGLIHDCTRELELEKQQNMLTELGINVDDMIFNTKELIHAYAAEYIMRKQFSIEDEEIISAVRFHTTGRENMTDLEKIVFLADVVEPTRDFPGVELIRKLSTDNLDEAVLAALDSSIRFLMGKRSSIHPYTFFARNYIIKYFKK